MFPSHSCISSHSPLSSDLKKICSLKPQNHISKKMNSSHLSNHSFLLPSPFSAAVMVTNIVFSLPSNSYIVWLIATGPKGKVIREFFQLNLSVFEVFYSFSCMTFFVKFSRPAFHFPSGLYRTLFWSGRPLLQCCICMEHFVAVVHPVLYLRYRSVRVKAAVAAAAWAIVFLSIFLYILFPNFKEWVLAIGCIAFMSVMLFCYVCVFAALRKPRPGEGRGERDRSVKTRAIYFITAILVSFSLGYLMWSINLVVDKVVPGFIFMSEFNRTSNLIIYICGLVQPFMYLQRRGKRFCRKTRQEAK